MPLEYGTFGHGGVVYPLDPAIPVTTVAPQDVADLNLKLLDPSLFYAREFLATVLDTYMGDRLRAIGKKRDLKWDKAVRTKLNYEPRPFLLNDQFQFPLFALYRKSETELEFTAAYDYTTAEWEFVYVLPPLAPEDTGIFEPFLRAATRIIGHTIGQGWDPSYQSGLEFWGNAASNIKRAWLKDAKYGSYQAIDNIDSIYRAVIGTLIVEERDMPVTGAFVAFDGTDGAIDARDEATDTTLPDVVDVSTFQGPTVATCSPNAGPVAGGTSITITGTSYIVGQPVTVLIGTKPCSGATIVSTTTISATTPQHDAFGPSLMSDVTVIAFDGQSATLPAAFTYS